MHLAAHRVWYSLNIDPFQSVLGILLIASQDLHPKGFRVRVQRRIQGLFDILHFHLFLGDEFICCVHIEQMVNDFLLRGQNTHRLVQDFHASIKETCRQKKWS